MTWNPTELCLRRAGSSAERTTASMLGRTLRRLAIAASTAALATFGYAQTSGSLLRPLPSKEVPTLATMARLADVDGDGDLDLVSDAANGFLPIGRSLGLRINGGAADFEPARRIAEVDVRPMLLVPFDADADGDVDVLFASMASGSSLTLLLNSGDGTFVAAAPGALPPNTWSVSHAVAGDLDGDGDADLLLGVDNGRGRILINDGAGGYADGTAGRLPTSSELVGAVWLADLDRDSDLDVISRISVGGPLRVLVNDGAGSFRDDTAVSLPGTALNMRTLQLGDVDGDGDVDLAGIIADAVVLLDNRGDGVLTRVPTMLPDSRVFSLGLVDFDGDGDLDLITTGIDGVESWRNDGGGQFSRVSLVPDRPSEVISLEIVSGDLDADGDADLVIAGRVYLGNGRGGFLFIGCSRVPEPWTTNVAASALGDVDGDDAPDLFVSRTGWVEGILPNDGSGSMCDDPVVELTQVRTPARLGAKLVDLDGDADLDVFVALASRNSQIVYINQGNRVFVDESATRLPPIPLGLRAYDFADVDGDGDVDALLAIHGRDVRLLRNDGRGNLTNDPALFPITAEQQRCVHFADMDGDGDEDVWIGSSTEGVDLYLNDGGGNFTALSSGNLPPNRRDPTEQVVTADFDCDGDLDLALVQSTVRLWRNESPSRNMTEVTAAWMNTSPTGQNVIRVGDFNGDGLPDLLTVGSQIQLFLNEDARRFTNASSLVEQLRAFSPVQAPTDVHVADLDRDGDLDFVVRAESVTLVFNHLRHLHAPYPARVGQPYELDISLAPGLPVTDRIAALFVGFGALGTPLQTPLGSFGLDPAQLIAQVPVTFANGSGTSTLALRFPADTTLAGLTLHFQALMASSDPATVGFTPVVSDQVLRF